MQQVSMDLNCSSRFIEAINNETREPTQLSNVHNFQSPLNMMGEKIPVSPADTYFASQHVSQNSQQLFTSQDDQTQLQQQYYSLQLNDSCYQIQTPAFQMTGTSNFYPKTESFKQDDFSLNAFAIQQSPADISDYNRDIPYCPQSFNDLVDINTHVDTEQHIRQTTYQMQSPPMSHRSIGTEQSHTYGYSTPPPPMDISEEIFSPSTGVKKAPKRSSRTFKELNEKYSSQPGPIRASPPMLVFDETIGKEFLVFSYSNKKVITKFSLHCPQIDFSAPLDLDEEFLRVNCIYPGAMCAPEVYSGRRRNYERECNIIGWKLAEFNPEIQGRIGLIQRAVDSWRNTREDIKIRSRRIRKEQRMKKRKQMRSF